MIAAHYPATVAQTTHIGGKLSGRNRISALSLAVAEASD